LEQAPSCGTGEERSHSLEGLIWSKVAVSELQARTTSSHYCVRDRPRLHLCIRSSANVRSIEYVGFCGRG